MSADAFPDAPFSVPTRIVLDALPLAVVRHEGIRLDALEAAFDQGYAAVGALFSRGVLIPAGPALAVYHGDPQDVFDLELGFPLASPLPEPVASGDVTVQPSMLPAGPAYAATHVGSYDGLGDAWQQLAHSVDAAPRGVWIESYVSDPSDTAPDDLRTDLIMPVGD